LVIFCIDLEASTCRFFIPRDLHSPQEVVGVKWTGKKVIAGIRMAHRLGYPLNSWAMQEERHILKFAIQFIVESPDLVDDTIISNAILNERGIAASPEYVRYLFNRLAETATLESFMAETG
jgi:hypothetical protein